MVNSDQSTINLTQSRAVNNLGSGITLVHSTMVASELEWRDNTGRGCIRPSNAIVSIRNSSFADNSGLTDAAVVFSSNSHVSMHTSTISGNRGKRGGVVFITGTAEDEGVFTLANSTISNNEADDGGVFYYEFGTHINTCMLC